LKGVLAHELAHIKHRDILVATVAATIAGAISYLAQMAQWTMFFGGRDDERDGGNPLAAIVMMIVAPIAALLIQMAISRSREYGADAGGAQLAGKLLHTPLVLHFIVNQVEERPGEAHAKTFAGRSAPARQDLIYRQRLTLELKPQRVFGVGTSRMTRDRVCHGI